MIYEIIILYLFLYEQVEHYWYLFICLSFSIEFHDTMQEKVILQGERLEVCILCNF